MWQFHRFTVSRWSHRKYFVIIQCEDAVFPPILGTCTYGFEGILWKNEMKGPFLRRYHFFPSASFTYYTFTVGGLLLLLQLHLLHFPIIIIMRSFHDSVILNIYPLGLLLTFTTDLNFCYVKFSGHIPWEMRYISRYTRCIEGLLSVEAYVGVGGCTTKEKKIPTKYEISDSAWICVLIPERAPWN